MCNDRDEIQRLKGERRLVVLGRLQASSYLESPDYSLIVRFGGGVDALVFGPVSYFHE